MLCPQGGSRLPPPLSERDRQRGREGSPLGVGLVGGDPLYLSIGVQQVEGGDAEHTGPQREGHPHYPDHHQQLQRPRQSLVRVTVAAIHYTQKHLRGCSKSVI